MPRVCEFYPGIFLTTEEKPRKSLSQGKETLSQGKQNLNQSTVYTLPKHPHITTPTHTHTHTHTLQNPPTHTRTHITKPTHTHTHLLLTYSMEQSPS